MYSCALWSDAEGGMRGDLVSGPTPGDLEAAQLRKIRHVLTATKVKPGDRILEFGSGWGGMAIEVRHLTSVCATVPHTLNSFRPLALLAAKLIP